MTESSRYSAEMSREKAGEKVDKLIETVHSIRLEKGISHEKLAQMTGLNRATISLTESRKSQPTVLTLIRMTDALGIRLKDLIEQSEIE